MRIKVLDHGYVKLVEAFGVGVAGDVRVCGSTEPPQPDFEVGIIEAARQSTQGGFRGWGEDERLLRYLYNHNHATPFEFAGMVIEVQAPIFVFREWQRHRTQSYNEMSARYAPLPDLCYMPSNARCLLANQATTNKQAQSVTGKALNQTDAATWLAEQARLYDMQEAHYQHGLAIGVPKEVARIGMPVGHYSRMRASANLRNWLAFLTLRMDENAQWEIRQFANAVGRLIKKTFPQTWKLFQLAGNDGD